MIYCLSDLDSCDIHINSDFIPTRQIMCLNSNITYVCLLWYQCVYSKCQDEKVSRNVLELYLYIKSYMPFSNKCFYFWSKVDIWNVNCALATALIFDTRTDVLVKVSKFLRQKMSRPERDSIPSTFGFMPNALTIWIIRARHLLSHVFTRGQFWPSGIVIACVCVCVRVCVCVSVCVSITCLSAR